MRFRNHAMTIAAVVAAGALVLSAAAPASAVTPIDRVLVGNNAANTSYGFSGGPVLPSGFTLETTYGDGDVGCYGGTAGGLVRGGTTGIDPAPAFTLDELSTDCSFIPGTVDTVDFVAGCDIDVVMNDDNVHDGDGVTVRTDTGGTSSSNPNYVSGTAFMSSGGVPCVSYTMSFGCTFWIKGYVTVQFHEGTMNVNGVGHQALKFVGGGLEVAGAPYAPTPACAAIGITPGNDIKSMDFTVAMRVLVSGNWKPVDFVPA